MSDVIEVGEYILAKVGPMPAAKRQPMWQGKSCRPRSTWSLNN